MFYECMVGGSEYYNFYPMNGAYAQNSGLSNFSAQSFAAPNFPQNPLMNQGQSFMPPQMQAPQAITGYQPYSSAYAMPNAQVWGVNSQNPIAQGYYIPQNYDLQQTPPQNAYYMPQSAANEAFVRPQEKFPQAQKTPPARNLHHKTNEAKLSMFFINDMHGHIDNMTNILGASMQFDRDARAKGADVIKLSAGDNFAGSDTKKNNLMLNFLDFIGVRVSAVGNHEFDAGASEFYDSKRSNKIQFVSANAKTPEGSEFYNNVNKSVVVEANGNKYGIVGLMPVDLETVAGKIEKLEGIKPFSLEDSVKCAQEEIDKLREMGINKIILTTHLGIDKDKEIASMLDGVDIIQGGHSHNLTPELKQGENIVYSKTGEPVIIVQGGENGKYAGVLDVEFDENGIIKTASLGINRAELEKSPVLEYIKSATLGPSPKLCNLIGADPLPENRRITPCAWTNLICDSMRSEMNVDIAIVNAANIRKVPKAGIITERDVTETTPLSNMLVVTKMTEKEIVEAIKAAAQRTLGNPTGEPGLLHASGLNYKASSTGELLEMSFVDKMGNITPIDINNPSEKVYTVCADSFVTDEREMPEYPEMQISRHKYREAQHFAFDKDKTAIDYIKKMPKNEPLKVTDDGRMQIIEADGSPRTVLKEIEVAKAKEADIFGVQNKGARAVLDEVSNKTQEGNSKAAKMEAPVVAQSAKQISKTAANAAKNVSRQTAAAARIIL